jgi:DNA modification methylase
MEINNFYIGDNLELLKSVEDCSVQLVYLDPPYNTGRDFNDFDDRFSSISNYAYEFLQPRFTEIKRILKNDGIIVVHVEPKISHYVRMALDNVFGFNNFQNEIVWKSGGNKKSMKKLQRFHDTIIVYSKTSKYKYIPMNMPYDESYRKSNSLKKDERGEYTTSAAHNSQPDVSPRMNLRYEWNGHTKQWYTEKERMLRLHNEDRLHYSDKGIPRFKKYLHEMDGIPVRDMWIDVGQIQNGEKLDYATQKPVKLLERIIDIYSTEGDLVLDPFGGSGSLGRAAINRNRNYLLFDINQKGKDLFLNSIK